MAAQVGDSVICPKCGIGFIKAHRTSSYCKDCRNAYQREWARKNKGKVRNWTLKKYGITEEEYNVQLAKQGGKCAICKSDKQVHERYGLSVDHDHLHGYTRGLLCDRCNMALGLFQDDPEVLRNAIEYLHEWEV